MFEVKFPLVANVKAGVKVDKEGELVNTISFETPCDVKALARFLYLVRSNMAVTCHFSTPQLQMDLKIEEVDLATPKQTTPPKETKAQDKDAFKSPVAAG